MAKKHWMLLGTGAGSDRRLKARVRSTLGYHVSNPGAIAVYVENGQVTLGGPVLVSEVAGLRTAVEEVKGVQGVLDHLEVQETLADAPKSRTLPPTARLLAGAAGGALALAGLKRRDKVGAALGGVGLGLLATGAIAGRNPVTLFRRTSRKLSSEMLPEETLRDAEQVPALGTEEGTFQPATI